MGVDSIHALGQLYIRHGVTTLYVKALAANQDNEKNQIYLGAGLHSLTNLFPAVIEARSPSTSTSKRASASGRAKVEARIRLAWIDETGESHEAPNARIIDYFQYPEVRLSGFLKGCDRPPDSLRRERQDRYGRRILVLGVAPDGRTFGRVLTERDDPLVRMFPDLPELPAAPILRVLPIGAVPGSTPLDLLRAELRAIVTAGWHPSRILRGACADPVPFKGPQGAGFTLEACLGVVANANKAPDRHGYEIKTWSGSRISLMTPTPDGGYQGTHNFRQFMAKYARAGAAGDGSQRFTGLYRCGATQPTNGMRLVLQGYDAAKDLFGDPEKIAVHLIEVTSGDLVASWSLEHLATSWNKKHASALYITYERRNSVLPEGGTEYRYARAVLIGEGTDVWRLLRAIHSGLVFYDPAHSIYPGGKPKVRPQWRVNTATLRSTMEKLYALTREIDL